MLITAFSSTTYHHRDVNGSTDQWDIRNQEKVYWWYNVKDTRRSESSRGASRPRGTILGPNGVQVVWASHIISWLTSRVEVRGRIWVIHSDGKGVGEEQPSKHRRLRYLVEVARPLGFEDEEVGIRCENNDENLFWVCERAHDRTASEGRGSKGLPWHILNFEVEGNDRPTKIFERDLIILILVTFSYFLFISYIMHNNAIYTQVFYI